MHALHPDVHEAGLADGCPACAKIAQNPTAEADERLLRQLVELAVADPREIPAGETQAYAVVQVLNTLERADRIAKTAPFLFEGYLCDRWRLHVSIGG